MESINTTMIGKGLYDMMNENQQSAVAFGMIPKEVMDDVMDRIKNRIAKILSDRLEMKAEDIYPCIKKDFIAKLEHDIALAIYGRAKELGQMIA